MLEEVLAEQEEKNKKLAERLFDLRYKEFELRRLLAIKTAELDCPHIAGSSPIGSGYRDIAGRTSIVWHDLNPLKSRIIGICTTCDRKFFPEDLDYTYWRSLPGFNRMSQAGVEVAVLDGETPDAEYLPTSLTFYEYPQRKTEEDLLRRKNFEDLSDFEIAKLMEYVRETRRKAKQAETPNE